MSNISADFATAWQRFQSAPSLRLLQETLEWEWTRGRTDFVAFLIPISDSATKTHIAGQIEAIRDITGVDPYPEDYWHITVKQVGFLTNSDAQADEVTADAVEQIAEQARSIIEAVQPFTARVGSPNAFEEVVFLEVLDGGAVRHLNTALSGRLDSVPRYPIDGAMWLPHVSVARFSSNDGLDELKARLASLRAEANEGPSFTVDEVMLIQAHLAAEAPTFDLLAHYELRG
jgi:2'-5' RNA ligase